GIRKIGFACDFRHAKDTTPASLIMEMVKEFGAELHILNVDYKEKHFSANTPEEMFELNNLFRVINPHYHFINSEDVEDGILEFYETHNLDLIISIPKKHKLLEGIFNSSSTKQFVFQSHIP